MAKKATSTSKPKAAKAKSDSGSGRALTTGNREDRETDDSGGAGEAFIKLLQSPLVAELLTVAATAALAALAEHGFSRAGAGDQRRAGRAVKAAGKAAAAAIGRRLATEVDEIRRAAREAKERAAA
ncbi:MAG TPA: hypothetical protein VM265_04840 [Sphingomicrobium sp.]|nr:hypothetical protein [Sphingomicrobium sp.]